MVARVMASLGKDIYLRTKAGTRQQYRDAVRGTLANCGFSALWMVERAIGCDLACRGAVAAMRQAVRA